MRSRLICFSLIIFVFCCIVPKFLLTGDNEESEDIAKKEDIRKFINLTWSGESRKESIQKWNDKIASFKDTWPEIPEEFWEKELTELKIETIINNLIPIYDKYFTHEEIKELIKFYESPVWKKYIDVLPKLLTGTEAVAYKLSEQATEKLKKEAEKLSKP